MQELDVLRTIGFAAAQILLLVCFIAALALARSHLRPPGWGLVVVGTALLVSQTILQFGGAVVVSLMSLEKFRGFNAMHHVFEILGIVGSVFTIAGLIKAVQWLTGKQERGQSK
ncbi:MAG: hypothetical protein V5B39_18940 [Accumulibacter sp.]|jgi:uncharacterized membrane protein|uniref:hypothetical protein n=1 Tax=Accumulibacter sp. TaxID=2053492 RepID=UPI001ACD256D|nr:hypothetical protein [Candidatus Accumulibacter necessarius]